VLRLKLTEVNQEFRMSIDLILQIVTIASAVLLVVSILLQQRGASLGAGFGSSGELFTSRRGVDKNLFEVTIVFAVVFVLSILASLLIPVIN
jgi:preprotein translocase subunit SecG